jgi:hypothetical protein
MPEIWVSAAMNSSSDSFAQCVHVQAAVRQSLGKIPECADLPPGQSGLAQPVGVDGQQFSW